MDRMYALMIVILIATVSIGMTESMGALFEINKNIKKIEKVLVEKKI